MPPISPSQSRERLIVFIIDELLNYDLIKTDDDYQAINHYAQPADLLAALRALRDYQSAELFTVENCRRLYTSADPGSVADQIIEQFRNPPPPPALTSQARAVLFWHEQHALIDRRRVAGYTESNQRSLAPDERRILDVVQAHYSPIQMVIRELAARYEQAPAMIEVNGNTVVLPLRKAEFDQLALDLDHQQRGLHAYYQHATHTLWRYLNGPNPWRGNEAVILSDHQQNLIAQIWSAVKDMSLPPALGGAAGDSSEVAVRVEHRVQLFIQRLAENLARAHNWDHNVDDMLEDTPSCSMYIEGALFESVLDHPLFERLLTPEKLRAEVRQCIREHLSVYFEQNNRQVDSIREAIEAFQVAGVWDALPVPQQQLLVAANLPHPAQQALITRLRSRYDFQDTLHMAAIETILASQPAHLLIEAREGNLRALLDAVSSPRPVAMSL